LTACTGGDSDEITRPADAVSTTAQASPTPTQPSPPPLPAAVSVKSKAGAEAAWRYFLLTWAYGFQTGDSYPLSLISDPSCKFCQSLVEDIDATRRDGHRLRGGDFTMTAYASIATDKTGDAYLISAMTSQAAGTLVDDTGKTVSTGAADPNGPFDALVWFRDGRWRVFRAATSHEGEPKS
jgi:hypothetical protein